MEVPYEEKLEKINDFINKTLEETSCVIEQLNGKKCMRTLALLSFAHMEVFASYWCLYKGKKEDHGDKIKDWINTFFLTEKNIYMEESPHYKNITDIELYKIRCNTVHFFSPRLPDKFLPKRIGITEDERSMNPNDAKNIFDFGTILISNRSLLLLILEGAKLMLNALLDNSDPNHIPGIERIYKKINEEGGEQINIDNHANS
ncbi:MAG: hypothetical protein WCJ84_00215 [Candidatus Peregrinibacteria bacterium]